MAMRPLTAVAVGSVLAIVLGLAGAVALAVVASADAANAALLVGGMWGVAVASAATLFLARRLMPALALAVGVTGAVVATLAFWVKNGFAPAAGLELLFAGLLAGGVGTAIAVVRNAGTGRRLA